MDAYIQTLLSNIERKRMEVKNMFQRTDRVNYLEQVHSLMNYLSLQANDIISLQKPISQSKTILKNSEKQQQTCEMYFQMEQKQELPQISQGIILIKQNYESLIKSKQFSRTPFHLKQILIHFYARSLDSNPQYDEFNDQINNQFSSQKSCYFAKPLSIMIQSESITLCRRNQSHLTSQFKGHPIFLSNLSQKITVLQPKIWIEINKKINHISVHSGDLQSVQNTNTVKLKQPLDSSLIQHHYDWKHCEKPFCDQTLNDSLSNENTQNPLLNLTHFRIFFKFSNKQQIVSNNQHMFDPFKTYLKIKVLTVQAKKRPQLKQQPSILEWEISQFEQMPKQIKTLYFRLKNVNLLTLCSKKQSQTFELTEELIQVSIHHSLVTKFQFFGKNQAPIGILNHLLKMKTNQTYQQVTVTSKIDQKSPKQIYELIQSQRLGYIRLKICCPKNTYPGSPGVMQIWPPFYCSPIHNHSQAFALVKVLMGEIRVQNYDDLTLDKQQKPYMKSDYTKGQYTWLSDNSYGIHRVMNLHPQTSITLQGYYDHKQGWDEAFSFIHQDKEKKEKEFAMYYPQHDWENYLFKRSIENQADKEFIDRVVEWYGLKDKETGDIDCSYGKFVGTMIREYNVLKEVIDKF